jgi:hypothetical protein
LFVAIDKPEKRGFQRAVLQNEKKTRNFRAAAGG